jgi:5'-nucleotidase
VSSLMSSGTWLSIVGTAAALCTTLSFVPQLVKMRRQGGRDLSWAMLGVKFVGLALWFGYGLLLRATPVLVANAATMALVGAAMGLKRASERTTPAAPRRLRIAIDMDEVIVDALGEHLRRYNAAFGARVSPADLRGRSLDDVVPADRVDATRRLLDESFFETLGPIDGAIEAIRELHRNHEIVIATAAMEVPVSFAAKFRWLQRHLPFVPPSHIVFCGDKAVIDADVLIDDSARHFARFKGRPLLFSAPHNASETRYERVGSWREVLDVLGSSGQPSEGAEGDRRRAA